MTATNESDRSPAPGIIPAPVHPTSDRASPSAATEKPAARKPGRRNPVRIAFTRVMSALHGDEYMVDAYTTAGPQQAARSDEAGPRAG
jgi:hypothetical protein